VRGLIPRIARRTERLSRRLTVPPRAARTLLFSLGITLALSTPLRAQAGGEALFLLLPIGARAVGMGETVVARRGGSEQIWWNPAGVIGDSIREIALHHSQTVVGQGNAIGYVMSTRKLGSFGISFNMLDLGTQDATDDQGQIQGRISTIDFAYGLTYALQLSRYLAVGATVKHVQLRVSCSGLCTDLPIGGSRSNGADVGALMNFGPKSPFTLGFAVRHLGVGSGQTRPARVNFGATYRVEAVDKYTDQVDVHTSADLVSTTGLDSTSARVGADVVFEGKIHVRGGYILDKANGSGAAIGFGITAGRFVFDLARTFGGLSAAGDKPPTYFSLRYLW
jgi:hypothetical protein